MGARQAIELVQTELRQKGIGVELVLYPSRRFAEPSSIGFKVDGKDHLLQFWEGSHKDEKVAEHVLIDVLSAFWRLPVAEAQARLEHERMPR